MYLKYQQILHYIHMDLLCSHVRTEILQLG